MLYFGFKNPRIVYNRLLALTFKGSGPIWLYLDRYGVFDNAYDQFKHDFPKKTALSAIIFSTTATATSSTSASLPRRKRTS